MDRALKAMRGHIQGRDIERVFISCRDGRYNPACLSIQRSDRKCERRRARIPAVAEQGGPQISTTAPTTTTMRSLDGILLESI